MSLIEKAIDRVGKGSNPSLQPPATAAEKLAQKLVADEWPIGETPSAVIGREARTKYSPREETALHRSEQQLQQPRRLGLKLAHMKAVGILTPDAADSEIAEEFRLIKRPLLRNAFEQPVTSLEHGNLVMITSSRPSEGKTFNAIGLAISIAMEFDKTVLLVDADLARPSVNQVLDTDSTLPGLVEYLLDGKTDLSAYLIKTDIPKLNILPAGSYHANATELLASQNMKDLTNQLSLRYRDRIVIFDSPPLLANSQAAALAAHMGQVMVVVEANNTSQLILKEALSLLDTNKVIGLILNKVKRGWMASYGYSGYAYYGS